MNKIGTVMCIAALLLTGCGSEEPQSTANKPGSQAATSGVPEGIFLSEAPENAQPLGEIKRTASIGDEVVFSGRIGGRVNPFVDERAVFIIADTSLKICSELHGDSCPTPWDYCCEPRDSLMANTASVQIVDGEGKPLKMSLRGDHGLVETATVFVRGKVTAKDEAGTLVVNATGLYVQPI